LRPLPDINIIFHLRPRKIPLLAFHRAIAYEPFYRLHLLKPQRG
jgi:hypothetical protein